MNSLIKLLHDLTQGGYEVQFNSDFEGMVRIDVTKEHVSDFYEHSHIGIPGGTEARLLEETVEYLQWFKREFNVEDAEFKK